MSRDRHGDLVCHLCARPEIAPRAPTAEEKHRHGETSTDYNRGIYAIAYSGPLHLAD